MAGDNVLGTVSIVISGDTSRLQADFARAQALAITSGAQVSAAFNQSAAGADRVVVAIGKLAGIIQQESAAASLAAQRNLALAVSFQQTQVAAGNTARAVTAAGNAHTAVVPQMAAVSGAIRTAFGEQSIRAVERFLTLIPGVGAALQAAFPIIGGLALLEMLSRLVSKSDDLKKAQEDLKGAVKETDDSYAHLVTTLDQLGAKQLGRDLGAAAEARARATLLRNEAGDLQKQVLAKQTEINQLRIPRQGRGDIIEHPIGTFTGSLAKETEVQVQTVEKQIEKLQNEIDGKLAEARDAVGQYGKLAAEQAGALTAAQLSNKQKSLAAETDAFRRALTDQLVISHGAAQQQIAAISDVDTHELRSAQEAVRAAAEKQDGITAIERAELPKRIALINQEAAAEAAGKDEAARKRIFELARGKVDAARVESGDKEKDAAHETLVAVTDLETKKGEIIARQANAAALAWDEAYSAIRSAAKQTADEVAKAAETNAAARVKVIETGEKSTAATDELAIIQQKLRLEQQYSLQVGHTGAQQLAYATQIEAIEARARAAKITGLNAELQTAIANSKDVEADEKVATIREQIAKLQSESDNAAIAAQTRLLDLIQRQTLEYKLRSTFVRAAEAVPGAVGGAVAKGVFDGKGIGRDIRDSLKGIGQELLGTALQAVIQQLIIKLGIQTIATGALNAIFGVHAGILTAHAAVTAANTGATAVNATVTGVNAISTDANTVSTNLNTFWLAIKSLFGFAEGGNPPTDRPSWVGEKGKEIFWPKTAGTIIPNHQIQNYTMAMESAGAATTLPGFNVTVPMPGLPPASKQTNPLIQPTPGGSTGGTTIHLNNAQFHGVQNVRQLMKEIATYAKTQSPSHSPYASK